MISVRATSAFAWPTWRQPLTAAVAAPFMSLVRAMAPLWYSLGSSVPGATGPMAARL